MAAALERVMGSDADLPAWMLNASSVYIHDFQETTLCMKLLRFLTNTAEAAHPKTHRAGSPFGRD